MSFEEAMKSDFEHIKVEHPLMTRMDYIRLGMGKEGEGYTTLKIILSYICMYDVDKMKDIILNGEWSVK